MVLRLFVSRMGNGRLEVWIVQSTICGLEEPGETFPPANEMNDSSTLNVRASATSRTPAKMSGLEDKADIQQT
jgi:hypothetical protein